MTAEVLQSIGLALLLTAGVLFVMGWAARDGQFEDLDGDSMLPFNDEAHPPPFVPDALAGRSSLPKGPGKT